MSGVQIPEVVQAYLAAYNQRDVQALVECVADGVVFENVSNSAGVMRIEGRAAFAELAGQAAALFTARTLQIRTAVVAGDQVALEIDWTGVAATDFGPFKAGISTSLRGASFFTLAGGKLVRIIDLS